MKNFLTSFLMLLSWSIMGQTTWNQRIPLPYSPTYSFQDVQYENERLLVCGGGQFLECSQAGEITGYDKGGGTSKVYNFIRKRVDPHTGALTFLLGGRSISSSGGYTLRFFKPGVGIAGGIELPDSFGSILNGGPAVSLLQDNTMLVLGKTMAYKVQAVGDSAFTILWQKPLSIPSNGECVTAVQVNNDFVAFCTGGQIIGISSTGQQTFTKTLPFTVKAAVVLQDGIMACGKSAAQKAVLVKLSLEGDIIWSKEYDDKLYGHLALAPNGGFILTGSSAEDKIVLVNMTVDGQKIWSKAFQTGTGLKVLPMPAGGYFILAATNAPNAVYGIRTNESGASTTPINEYFTQNRQLSNQGVQVTLGPTASLFFNGSEATLISAEDSAATILAFTPWIGGLDADGALHLAAETYTPASEADFHPGYINGVNGDFNRVWKITKKEITALRRDFLTDNVLDAAIPYDLLTWPAKGNVHNQYNLDFSTIKTDPGVQSAPFIDLNGDGVYNVYDGDYPLLKGDQMAYWVLNDDSTHLNSGGLPLKVDLSISAYLYDCPENESVKNSLFVDFELINRSEMGYENTYMGFFTDFDLGCILDDYIGSIPETNSYYVYNEDDFDGPCAPVHGFGADIPVQTVTFQNQALNHFIYMENESVGSPNPAQTSPVVPIEFYHYLQGKWRDGTPLTAGGTGYNPGSTNQLAHAFPGNPSNPQSWSQCSAALPYDDIRTMGTHGPFHFESMDTFRISVAFTTHKSIPLPCPDISSLVKPSVQNITNWSTEGALEAAPNLGIVQTITAGSLTLGTDVPGAMFQWSTGATNPFITVSQPGEYSVTMTSTAGCQSVETVLVKQETGVNSPRISADWEIRPNPATAFVQVSCPDCAHDAEIQAVLRNAQGMILHRETYDSNAFSMPLQGLSSGFYWLELWQGEAFLGSRKLVHLEE